MTEINYCAGSASDCLDLVFEAAETEAAYLQNTCPPTDASALTCRGQLTLPVLLPLLQSHNFPLRDNDYGGVSGMATRSLLLLFVQKLLRFLDEAGKSIDRIDALSLTCLFRFGTN